MELNFKEFLEGQYGLNAPGRAGQHVWKPESPVISDPLVGKTTFDGPEKLKGVKLNQGFRPLPAAPFRGITADKFGIQVKKSPKPKT